MSIVNEKVWVVEYGEPDFHDCNGVFSSRTKALAHVLEDYARCFDCWTGLEVEESCLDEDRGWLCLSFQYTGEDAHLLNNAGKISIEIYETFIQ